MTRLTTIMLLGLMYIECYWLFSLKLNVEGLAVLVTALGLILWRAELRWLVGLK